MKAGSLTRTKFWKKNPRLKEFGYERFTAEHGQLVVAQQKEKPDRVGRPVQRFWYDAGVVGHCGVNVRHRRAN